MKILVDSHVAVWWLSDPSQIKSPTRSAIQDPANQVFLSAASVWELSLKISKGKLVMPVGFADELKRDGFDPLPISAVHALATSELPQIHSDPFDRMLIAQAREEGLLLATRDGLIRQYDVATLEA